ncbi:hypothetical protein [Hydrogenophaga sp.]|uniref:hypothetical protein n=1 Tax=Hydrogenophaga sp. TaxID=1904254 RepID=UPI003D9B3C93
MGFQPNDNPPANTFVRVLSQHSDHVKDTTRLTGVMDHRVSVSAIAEQDLPTAAASTTVVRL